MSWKIWYGIFYRKLLWKIDVYNTIQYKTILRHWSNSICMNCVYNVHIITDKCSKKKHHAISKFIVPWTQGVLHGLTR